MDERIENFHKYTPLIVKGSTVDLSGFSFMHPWDIGAACLFLVERHSLADKKIILPQDVDLLHYLKRIHFNEILHELGYKSAEKEINSIVISEKDNLNIHSISHCKFQDEFNARLGQFERMFRNFGLNEQDARRALIIFGELGNNVFDHNVGNWPTDFSGSIVVAQNYPKRKRIECVVADAGVGFLGSLRAAFPDLQNDIDAIQKGLLGYTGRIGENRGNGLKTIQNWTIKNFRGIVDIYSGKGLVEITEQGTKSKDADPILGTLVQFVIYYK